MKRVGVFYDEILGLEGYPVLKDRVKAGIEGLNEDGLLEKILIFKPTQPSEELLRTVHSERLICAVKKTKYHKAALLSAGGVILAGERVFLGEIDNAFVFTGTAGHHAGVDDFWGFCYFNDVALSISNLRLKFNSNLKFSILDTDSHHGDGTRDIFKFDNNVQHVCFCNLDEPSTDELKIDIPVPSTISDEDYIKLVEENYFQRLRSFKPDMVFWHFGYDTYKEDYGSRGLTEKCFLDLTKKVKNITDEVCSGKLIVVLCGGSSKRFAKTVFPKLIKILAEIEV